MHNHLYPERTKKEFRWSHFLTMMRATPLHPRILIHWSDFQKIRILWMMIPRYCYCRLLLWLVGIPLFFYSENTEGRSISRLKLPYPETVRYIALLDIRRAFWY